MVRAWVITQKAVWGGKHFKERRGMIRVAFQKDQSGCMVENVLEKSRDKEENSEGLTCGLDDSGHCGNGAACRRCGNGAVYRR